MPQAHHPSPAHQPRRSLPNLLQSTVAGLVLACGLTASAQTVTRTTNFVVNTAIPDGNLSGLASAKMISTPVVYATDVNVTLKITGTFNGDLYCYLTHGAGHSVLLNRVGRLGDSNLGYDDDGFNVKFDDAAANGDVHVYRLTLNGNHTTPITGALTNCWAPDGRATNPTNVLDTDARSALLSSFNGLDPNGEWVLYLADTSAGDLSTLVSWGVEITGYTAPSITMQPSSQEAECAYGNPSFSVTATGSAPLSYQWRVGGNPLPGATGDTLTLNQATSANAGSYDVIVTNPYASATSSVATLTVVDTTAPVITLNGAATLTLESHGSSYTELGASVSDGCDLALTSATVGGDVVNVNVVGTYVVTYNATDASGNHAAQKTRTVQVVEPAARPLTVTATGVGKVYDGTTTATVTLSDDHQAGDNVTDSYTSASFSDKNVGTGKAVSVSGISISGADASRYVLQNTTASTTANITARPLTVTATGINKVYDGTTDATVTLSDNRVASDSFGEIYGSASFSDSNVGTGKTVTITGITIMLGASGNYVLQNTTATATADITRPPTGTVKGLIELQGYVGSHATNTFVATDDSGQVLAVWQNVNLDTKAGSYADTFRFALTGVPEGTTHLSAKATVSLRRRLAVTFDGNHQAQLHFVDPALVDPHSVDPDFIPASQITQVQKLKGGDLTNDNVVNTPDYTLLRSRWLTAAPDADINGDGIVNQTDYDIMKTNWFTAGDPQ